MLHGSVSSLPSIWLMIGLIQWANKLSSCDSTAGLHVLRWKWKTSYHYAHILLHQWRKLVHLHAWIKKCDAEILVRTHGLCIYIDKYMVRLHLMMEYWFQLAYGELISKCCLTGDNLLRLWNHKNQDDRILKSRWRWQGSV